MKCYELMPQAQTYALGVQALRDSYKRGECPSQPTVEIDGKQWVRPLTLKENLQARLEVFETVTDMNGKGYPLQDRLRLFNHWIESCTGIVHEEGTTRFKVIPICRALITIDPLFDERVILVSYDDIHGDNNITLDSNDGIYNKWLTREQVMNHPAWRAIVGDDEDGRKLLQEYSQIICEHGVGGDTMGFFVCEKQEQDELHPLYISNSIGASSVYGYSLLNFNGLFLRITPSEYKRREGGLSLCDTGGELSLTDTGKLSLTK